MSTSCLSVLEVIREYAPHIQWRTTSNPRSKYTMKCPLCEYVPRHNVQPNYFTVTQNEQLFSCHVCHAAGNAFQLRRHLTQGHNFAATNIPEDTSLRQASNGRRAPWEGATVEALAQAKGLDPDWLKDTLGWKNTTYRGSQKPVIEIPYPDENNHAPLTRFKVGVSGDGERYIWNRFTKGQRQRPYGLWTLPQAREQGFIIVEEGETDFASLHYADLPALGIPGNSWSKDLKQRRKCLNGAVGHKAKSDFSVCRAVLS